MSNDTKLSISVSTIKEAHFQLGDAIAQTGGPTRRNRRPRWPSSSNECKKTSHSPTTIATA